MEVILQNSSKFSRQLYRYFEGTVCYFIFTKIYMFVLGTHKNGLNKAVTIICTHNIVFLLKWSGRAVRVCFISFFMYSGTSKTIMLSFLR